MLRQAIVLLTSLVLTAGTAFAQPPTEPPDGFVPASSLPPGEQLPAAPFLVGSYAFFLVLMLLFLWTIWSRIGKVEKELRALERKQGVSR